MNRDDAGVTRARADHWAAEALIGGVGCLVGDRLHVAYGVLVYSHPVLWQQAWWVFPLFFLATLGVLAGARLVHPNPPPYAAPMRATVVDSLLFFAAYAFTAVGSANPNVVLGALLAAWVLHVLRGMPEGLVLFCLVTASVGTAFEVTLTGFGGFTYLHPDFLGVPRWLPALYLHAAVAGDSARRLLPPVLRA